MPKFECRGEERVRYQVVIEAPTESEAKDYFIRHLEDFLYDSAGIGYTRVVKVDESIPATFTLPVEDDAGLNGDGFK